MKKVVITAGFVLSLSAVVGIGAIMLDVGGLVKKSGVSESGIFDQFKSEAATEPKIPPPEKLHLVPLPSVTVPIIKADGQVDSHFFLVARLDVPDASMETVKQRREALADAFFRALHDFLPEHMAERSWPDLRQVKHVLTAVAHRELGGHRVNGVLIQQAYLRSYRQ